MFPSLPAAQHNEQALLDLASHMVDDPEETPVNPPVVSLRSGALYFAQFVDHDLSLDVTPLARAAAVPPERRTNYRSPRLNLEPLYGEGPKLSPWLYHLPAGAPPGHERFLLGKTTAGRPLDLPRTAAGRPVLGDPRNEENLILAQLHVVLLSFHNRLIEALETGEIRHADIPGRNLFQKTRRLVEWHYQALILKELLKPLLPVGTLEDAIARGRRASRSQAAAKFRIPVEFALAAFRFGHTMVRNEYTFHPGRRDVPLAALLNMHSQGEPPLTALPDDWVIEWANFFEGLDRYRSYAGWRQLDAMRSRGFDPNVAKALHSLPFPTPLDEPADPTSGPRFTTSLPAITLLRGYRSGLPSGQQVACYLKEARLTEAELTRDLKPAMVDCLSSGGFLDATPLWFYILQEAAARGQKNRFGPVGSRIIADTIISALMHDETSILRDGEGWAAPQWGASESSGPTKVESLDVLIRVALRLPLRENLG